MMTRFDQLVLSLEEYRDTINNTENAKLEVHIKNHRFSISVSFFRTFNYIKDKLTNSTSTRKPH